MKSCVNADHSTPVQRHDSEVALGEGGGSFDLLTKLLRLTGFALAPLGISLIVLLTAIAAVCAGNAEHGSLDPALEWRPNQRSSAPLRAVSPKSNGNCPVTSADLHGWGAPNRSADFTDSSSLAAWQLYDGPGHAGNGRRTPSAVSVANGLLTITGDAEGNSEGMAWLPGQTYGRWEACVKSPPASPNYHSLLLLWPDSDKWPLDGEIDFMEILDPERQEVTASIHFWGEPAPEDREADATVSIDATKWHSWAVEWTPARIVGYVDGRQWFEVTTHVPQGPMHLCIQLDNFAGDISDGGQEIVDWARQYPAPKP